MDDTQIPAWMAELSSPLADTMGIQITEVSPERAVGRMPVEGNTQPMGLLHGGANAVLMETLASIGATAHARTLGGIAVGLDLNVTHHRGVRDGWVTGTATALQLGRTVASYLIEVHDEAGNRTATGRLTCLVRSV